MRYVEGKGGREKERDRETHGAHNQRRVQTCPLPANSAVHVHPGRARVCVYKVGPAARRRARRRMDIAVPSRPARPIRAERELREGGTRCSFAYIFRGIYYSVCKYVAKMISLPRGRRRSLALGRARASAHSRTLDVGLAAAPLTGRPARLEPGGGARRQRSRVNDGDIGR